MDARLVVGLVGQICSGKSTVADMFEKRGARVYRADQIVHALYRRPDVQAEVRALFGDGAFDAGGNVNRKQLGEWVFADSKKLDALTQKVIFPRTGEVTEKEIKRFRSDPRGGLLLLDAPTLFEAGRADVCDRTLFVSAPHAKRVQWAKESRGWDAEELARRERNLIADGEKMARCNTIIENVGSLEDLDARVQQVWTAWVPTRGKQAGNTCS